MTPNTDFTARRDQVSNRLASLREQRGAAIADGKRFDDGMIAQAEAELQAIEDAEAEIARRERNSNSAAYKAQRQRDIASLLEKDTERLECVRRKEAAARALAAAVREEHQLCAEERKLFTALKRPLPDSLVAPWDIGSQLLMTLLATMEGVRKSNYGRIKWPGTFFTDKTDWVSAVTISNLKEMFQ